ncbi:hypothetical protein [Vibrio alfacsensis]|uniref:hypothetical protein n=1 Tax=Vibrio alfacsensis TaxID=1074311 RepID=UPI004068E8AF
MLDKLKTLSNKTRPILPLFVLVAIIGAGIFVLTLFQLTSMVEDSYLIPSGVTALWALAAWVIISSFQSVPEINPELGLLKRVKARCVRFLFYWLALGFVALSGFILLVTLRMLSVWFRQ